MDTTDYTAAEQAASYFNLSGILGQTGWTAVRYLLRLALAIFLIWLIRKILSRISNKLEGWLEKKNLAPNIRHFVLILIKYVILVLAIFYILTGLDIVETSAIAALIASAGVAVSLAAQGTLSNLAGGLIMIFVHPFKVGDYICVPDLNTEGTVMRMELYYTTLEDVYHSQVMIPNSQLTNHTVQNLAHDYRKRLDIRVQIAYEADIRAAKQILQNLAGSQAGILPDPVQCGVSELKDSGVELYLRAWVKAQDYNEVRWEMLEKIQEAFRKGAVEIPYPQMDVHLK